MCRTQCGEVQTLDSGSLSPSHSWVVSSKIDLIKATESMRWSKTSCEGEDSLKGEREGGWEAGKAGVEGGTQGKDRQKERNLVHCSSNKELTLALTGHVNRFSIDFIILLAHSLFSSL